MDVLDVRDPSHPTGVYLRSQSARRFHVSKSGEWNRGRIASLTVRDAGGHRHAGARATGRKCRQSQSQ
jgi:hypothetical protein